jgi:hypothetical protein
MASDWTRCRGSVPSNLEVAGEQPLHRFVILKDHYHVYRFHADLQAPASARNRNEGRRTPAIRRTAGGYALAPFSAEDKTAFDHVRNNGHALCMLQYFFRDSLVRHPHNFVHHAFGVVEPVGGIFPRRSRPAQRAESKHRKYEDYFFHGTPSFLLPLRRFSGFMLCLPAQIRVEIRAHQGQFDVTKSGLKWSEQKCSHLARGNSRRIEREEIYQFIFVA